MTSTRLLNAILMATQAHAGQVRRYENDPYIVHPLRVARTVAFRGHDEDTVIAAILHDTLEDTNLDPRAIDEQFGGHVLSLVRQLTDPAKPEDGNRAARMEINREHAAKASPQAQTVRVADLMDNARSIVAHDPSFAKVYLKEKALMLDGLSQADSDLLRAAHDMILEFTCLIP
jgi:(p)ppGpp synthase/HD superfamily hydrolase